jgi:hypothetical protein
VTAWEGLEEVGERYREIDVRASAEDGPSDEASIRADLRHAIDRLTWSVMGADGQGWSRDSLPPIREAACALGAVALRATRVLGLVPYDHDAPIAASLRSFPEERDEIEEAMARNEIEAAVGPKYRALSAAAGSMKLALPPEELVAASHDVVAGCARLMLATDEAA